MRAVRSRVLVVAASAAIACGVFVAVSPAAQALSEPAASGFKGDGVDLTDIVRVAPGSDGTQTAVPLTAGATGQQAPDLQIRLPIKTEATATAPGREFATWQPGDALTVQLPAGVTFAATPKVTAGGLVDVAPGAAFGSAVTAALTADAGSNVTLAAPVTAVALSADRSTARILITSSQWADVSAAAQQAEWINLKSAAFTPATADPGFVLTVSGVRLSVAKGTIGAVTATVAGEASNGFYGKPEYATYPAVAPAACTVGTAGGTRNVSYVGGTTTLGVLSGLSITANQPAGQVLLASDALQSLPQVSVRGAFASAAGYALSGDVMVGGAAAGSVLFDFPAHKPAIPYLDATLAASGVSGVSLAPTAGQYGLARTAQLTLTAASGGNGSVTVSGLRISGYVPTGQMGARAVPAGSTVRISVTEPAGADLAVNDTATVGCLTKPGASTFSDVTAKRAAAGSDSTSLKVAVTADRIAGLNRYGTAALLAEQYVAQPGTTLSAVVLANGEDRKGGFDALSANYLAGRVHAPILLTAVGTLPRETAQALRSVASGAGAVTLYVMGKSDSVSDAVAGEAQAILASGASGAVTIKRIAGGNRFATSVDAASVGTVGSASFAKGSPSYKTAILASGLVGADALAAGPLSFSSGFPVLLTGAGATLPAEVAAFISSQKIRQIFVIGGNDRVTTGQLAQLRALGVSVVKRIAGANRFATSADLYTFAVRPSTTAASAGGGLGWGTGATAYLANGVTGFPDALAVGPLAGSNRAVLATTAATRLDPAVSALTARATTVVALGQPASVPAALLKK